MSEDTLRLTVRAYVVCFLFMVYVMDAAPLACTSYKLLEMCGSRFTEALYAKKRVTFFNSKPGIDPPEKELRNFVMSAAAPFAAVRALFAASSVAHSPLASAVATLFTTLHTDPQPDLHFFRSESRQLSAHDEQHLLRSLQPQL